MELDPDGWVLMEIESNSLTNHDQPQIANAFALQQNYPNPFNPTTAINLVIAQTAHVELTIYDLLGREVVKLVDGVVEPGNITVLWSGRDAVGATVPSGIYIVRMEASGYSETIKMVLLK